MAFAPQNAIEHALVKASTDPSYRPQFYKELAQCALLVIQEPESSPRPTGHNLLTGGDVVKLKMTEYEGRVCVQAFTSLSRLKVAIAQPVNYLALGALELMELTAGSDLLLNPGADYGKVITAQEAAAIVNGSIGKPTKRVITEEVNVFLGQPSRHPTDLADALTRLFSTDSKVKRAWIATLREPQDDKPHTLIGIEAGDHYDAVLKAIGMATTGVNIPDPPIDAVPVGAGGPLDDYFLRSAKPFYKRRFLGIF